MTVCKNTDTLWEYFISLHLGKCSSAVMYHGIVILLISTIDNTRRYRDTAMVSITNLKVSTISNQLVDSTLYNVSWFP